ncbi:hypothetical protein ACA910_005334 [Epithemia clementina (nom. ined.)]
MYWADAVNVLQDLSQFKKLYVVYHNCATSAFGLPANDEENLAYEGYWYLGYTQPYRANVAFSLYGILKGRPDRGCNRATFINSFFTRFGAQTFVEAMQLKGHIGGYQGSNYDYFANDGFSSVCFRQFGDDDGVVKDDDANGGVPGFGEIMYPNASSTTLGCSATQQFQIHSFQGMACNLDKFTGVTNYLEEENKILNNLGCVPIYDTSTDAQNDDYYTKQYEWNTDDFFSSNHGGYNMDESEQNVVPQISHPLDLVKYSQACSILFSPESCPDPHGLVQSYLTVLNDGTRVRTTADYAAMVKRNTAWIIMVLFGVVMMLSAFTMSQSDGTITVMPEAPPGVPGYISDTGCPNWIRPFVRGLMIIESHICGMFERIGALVMGDTVEPDGDSVDYSSHFDTATKGDTGTKADAGSIGELSLESRRGKKITLRRSSIDSATGATAEGKTVEGSSDSPRSGGVESKTIIQELKNLVGFLKKNKTRKEGDTTDLPPTGSKEGKELVVDIEDSAHAFQDLGGQETIYFPDDKQGNEKDFSQPAITEGESPNNDRLGRIASFLFPKSNKKEPLLLCTQEPTTNVTETNIQERRSSAPLPELSPTWQPQDSNKEADEENQEASQQMLTQQEPIQQEPNQQEEQEDETKPKATETKPSDERVVVLLSVEDKIGSTVGHDEATPEPAASTKPPLAPPRANSKPSLVDRSGIPVSTAPRTTFIASKEDDASVGDAVPKSIKQDSTFIESVEQPDASDGIMRAASQRPTRRRSASPRRTLLKRMLVRKGKDKGSSKFEI